MSNEDRMKNVDPQRREVAADVTSVIKQAAAILQNELSGSATSARSMQQKFAETKKVDRGEFQELAGRVRTDVHDLIAIMGQMFTELQTNEVQSLVAKVAQDAHDVVDTTMNLVENTPAAAERFAGFGFTNPVPSPSADVGTDAEVDGSDKTAPESA